MSRAHKISYEIITEDMSLDEQFQIAFIIDKLSPSLKVLTIVLCHKTKEFLSESLIILLLIEEESQR